MSACNSRFRIGIDLGTTNCALASVAPDGQTSSVLEIPQPVAEGATDSLPTLPSFLYLPPAGSAGSAGSAWLAGRWAQARAAEVPGRVVASAKSWMVHHAADRRASFLPLGTADLDPADRLSPLGALSLLLEKMAAAWDAAHPDARLADQDLAITVPASFDPAAQQLTLEAARMAGFPDSTILLEEPQAAFYAWMESSPGALRTLAGENPAHVLVVDIGGGTTDLSLFAIEPADRPTGSAPRMSRIAVSDHILLGGDNLDLALAHHLESRLVPDSQLPAGTFARLLSRCREIKEEALGADGGWDGERVWPVAVAKPGASLLAGTLRSEVSSAEVSRLLLEGFFPDVGAREIPLRAAAGLREMSLPYAKDPAVTRHLAEFLHGRPPVDFILFNGGITKAPTIRRRILENIARWQGGRAPEVLENAQPDLAVARGAARFLHLRAAGDASQIEAGAAHSYYVGVGGGNLLCVLQHAAAPEAPQSAGHSGLHAVVGKPASFSLFRHARRQDDLPGALVSGDGFSELPVLEAVLSPPVGGKPPKKPDVRVGLRTTLRSTGLLRVELLCAERALKWDMPWPLEFSLRKQRPDSSTAPAPKKSSAPAGSVASAAEVMAAAFDGSRNPNLANQKITANAVFSAGEKALGIPKSAWTGGIVRQLFDALPRRTESADREESWLQVAGFLLRPGCGVPGDETRVEPFAGVLSAPPAWPSGSVKIQRWIAARRIAAGLDEPRALSVWNSALPGWREPESPPAEIALLAGALESLPTAAREDIARRIAAAIASHPQNSAYWKSLGRLLSRVLFHCGADRILPPDSVVGIWDVLRGEDVPEAVRPDAAAAWLRAARLTGLRPLDVPKSCRHEIRALLRTWEIGDVRLRVLEEAVPVAASDQTALLGESPPPGLSLA